MKGGKVPDPLTPAVILAKGQTIVDTTKTIYDHRREISSSYKTFRRWLRHHGHEIVIVGPGGCGKTTLGHMIGGKNFFDPVLSEFNESTEHEEFRRQGQGVYKVRVVPGQKLRRQRAWPSFVKSLADGKTVGVINVVSHGFHSFRELRMQDITSVYKPGMNSEQFIEAYTLDRRREEIEIASELASALKTQPTKLWMLTVMTKQDLWYPERIRVVDFYQQGDYNKCIEEVTRSRGSDHFAHEYHEVSLLTNNFRDGSGQVLTPIAEGYDQTLQFTYLKRLLASLNTQAERTDKHV